MSLTFHDSVTLMDFSERKIQENIIFQGLLGSVVPLHTKITIHYFLNYILNLFPYVVQLFPMGLLRLMPTK